MSYTELSDTSSIRFWCVDKGDFCSLDSLAEKYDIDANSLKWGEYKQTDSPKQEKCNANTIRDFFGIGVDKPMKGLLFFKNGSEAPINWNYVDTLNMGISKVAKLNSTSVLVLENTSFLTVDWFWKKNGRTSLCFGQIKYPPDSVKFSTINDTIMTCMFYWETYDMEESADYRVYCFFGEKTGIMDYRYSSYGQTLSVSEYERFDKLSKEMQRHDKNTPSYIGTTKGMFYKVKYETYDYLSTD